MELLRSRRILTEPEVRLFLIQMIGAVKYMHSVGVIHRDLKLGNIFLDANMNIKIGDFGLAALLFSKNDRKKTICGTPNYIAPEILYGRDKGHSYEVDIWSVGVIMYVMLLGKPPFQSKTVDTIYERIKTNDYKIPQTANISKSSRDLIKAMLASNPNDRPSIEFIVQHPFFTGPFPEGLDSTIIKEVPTKLSQLGKKESVRNYKNALIAAQIVDEDDDILITNVTTGVNVEEMVAQTVNAPRNKHSIIPNVLSPVTTKDKYREIVMQPAALSCIDYQEQRRNNTKQSDKNNGRGAKHVNTPQSNKSMHLYDANNQAPQGNQELVFFSPKTPLSTAIPPVTINNITTTYFDYPEVPDPSDIFKFGAINVADLLKTEFPEYHIASLEGLPSPQIVYITKWVDYSNKHGIGYELSNGVVGVLQPDGSVIQFNTATKVFDLIEPRERYDCMSIKRIPGERQKEKSFEYQTTLVTLMHSYMTNKLRSCGSVNSECVDGGYEQQLYEALQIREAQRHGKPTNLQPVSNPEGLVYLYEFKRVGDSYMFQLSNGDCQVNFPDHSKFVFQANGQDVAFITSDSIHYLGIKNGHICCEEWYETLCKDNWTLEFLKEKMTSCRKALKEDL